MVSLFFFWLRLRLSRQLKLGSGKHNVYFVYFANPKKIQSSMYDCQLFSVPLHG